MLQRPEGLLSVRQASSFVDFADAPEADINIMPDKGLPLADWNGDVSEEGQKKLNIRSCSAAMPRDDPLPNGLGRLAAGNSVTVNRKARPEGSRFPHPFRVSRLNGTNSGEVKRPDVWRVGCFGRPGSRESGARPERRPLYDGSHPAHPH